MNKNVLLLFLFLLVTIALTSGFRELTEKEMSEINGGAGKVECGGLVWCGPENEPCTKVDTTCFNGIEHLTITGCNIGLKAWCNHTVDEVPCYEQIHCAYDSGTDKCVESYRTTQNAKDCKDGN